MADTWTPDMTARALVKFLPMMGRVMAAHMQDANEDEGTLVQVLALTQLRGQPFTVSELAKRRKVSMQSASALVQRLVERGWVERNPDPDDRRQTLLELTPEGKARAQATFEQVVGHLAQFLEALTPDELEAAQIFLPALQRVMQFSTEETPAR